MTKTEIAQLDAIIGELEEKLFASAFRRFHLHFGEHPAFEDGKAELVIAALNTAFGNVSTMGGCLAIVAKAAVRDVVAELEQAKSK